ncbi:MFS transporter [Tepidibacillus marianensis]|uniref:MFS transporter n=1 Tax=Tepidibacillus marianensis TaxID=3131995 RepID=UPI0030D17FE6
MSRRLKGTLSREFFFISIILFIVEFVRGAYLITFLPNYAVERLGFSLAIVGIAVSAHYLTDTVVKTAIGYLLDRFSARFVVQIGLLLSLIGLFVMQYVHQPAVLIFTAAIYGIGASPVWLVSLGFVKQENRAQQMGYLYTGWLIGLGTGPVVINFFIDYSYIVAFWFMVGLWIVGILLSFGMKSGKKTSISMIPLKQQLGQLTNRLKSMGIFIPGMILQTMAAGMLVPILPSFATKYLGLSHTQYSYVLIAGEPVLYWDWYQWGNCLICMKKSGFW